MPVVNMSMTGADESVSGLPVAESKPETDVTERVSGQPPLLPARSALLNKEASATYISESLPNNIIESDSLVPKDLTATNELIAREQQQEPSSDKFVVTEEEESVW